MMIYLIKSLHNLKCFFSINNKIISWFIPIGIVLLINISAFLFGLVPIIYLIHLSLFWIIIDIISLVLKRFKIKLPNNYIVFTIVFIITNIYLGYAWFNSHNIIKTDYIIDSQKVTDEISIVLITDTHIGTTFSGNDFAKYLNKISEISPIFY